MTITNEEPVKNVINQYMEGTFQGDASKLRACFHPNAVMNGYLNGQLIIGTPEPFFQEIEKNPSMASRDIPYLGEVVSVEVEGQIASVTMKETGYEGELSFRNYFHLINTDGDWKIYSKTFTTI